MAGERQRARPTTTGLVFKGFEEFRSKLENMKTRAGSGLRSYLNSVVYTQIQNAQMQRWVSEGTSEGTQWDRLNPIYANRKLKKYHDYPGAGEKLLIATATLVSSVIGPIKESSAFGLTGSSDHHRKIIDNNSIFVGTDLNYAGFVNEKRSFTTLSNQTKKNIFDGISAFLRKGEKP